MFLGIDLGILTALNEYKLFTKKKKIHFFLPLQHVRPCVAPVPWMWRTAH